MIALAHLTSTLAAAGIALVPGAAFAWPKIDDPPRSKTEWVASDIRINGLPSRIVRFESELTPEDVLQFYRERWRYLSGGKGTRESTHGGWKAIATLVDPFQLAVQVRARTPHGSEGMISVANLADATREYIPAALPRFPDVAVIQVTDAVDGPKRSQLVTMVSTESFDLNLRRWKNEWARRGYALTNEKLVPPPEGGDGWIATFDKPPYSVDMTIGRDGPGDRTTHIVVNLVGPAEKGAR